MSNGPKLTLSQFKVPRWGALLLVAMQLFYAAPLYANESRGVTPHDLLRPVKPLQSQGLKTPHEPVFLRHHGSLEFLASSPITKAHSRHSGPREIRSLTGENNNLANPDWGTPGSELLREKTTAVYQDGESAMVTTRPNPRAISEKLFAQSESLLNPYGLSDFAWVWGQFIDHDLDLSLTSSEEHPITVPAGDPWFDPFRTGTQTIGFHRSQYEHGSNGFPRQQINEITAYLDGSMIYGSTPERAAWLRTGENGLLKTSAHATGDLLPFNDGSIENAEGAVPGFFVAGDVRANEQTALTALHTLFVREHNYWARKLARRNPRLDDEALYQKARAIVIAEIQVITYEEFLPAFLGRRALPKYRGYDASVNAGISNLFSTAAFRVGHTMVSETLTRLDSNGQPSGYGDLDLKDAFFNPSRITDEGGIEPVLRGLLATEMQNIDTKVVSAMRNFLFGPPGSGGFDIVALNIQRGRDHGLPDYNTVREAYGLEKAEDFADITSDADKQAVLAELYGDVHDIDVWVGALAEDHKRGAAMGELNVAIWVDQFTRLRDGDRFWYQASSQFPRALAKRISKTRLTDILKRNTSIQTAPRSQAFYTAPERGPLKPDFRRRLRLYFDFLWMRFESRFSKEYRGRKKRSRTALRYSFHKLSSLF